MRNEATQSDFVVLAEHLDAGRIVEIVATVALCGHLNRWNDTMAMDLQGMRHDAGEAGKHAAC